MINLKPCPFCGDSVNITYMSFENVFAIWHNNKACSLIEPQYIDGEDAKSLNEARDIWNKRVEKEESEKNYRTSKEHKMVNEVLDKIRDEIEKPLHDERCFDTADAKAQYIALNWCIETIDKYRKEQE